MIEAPAQERLKRAAADAITLRVVSRLYAAKPEPLLALRQCSLTVAAGDVVAVVGPSGCGKTTLLELICGLQQPDGGSVTCAPAALMPQNDLLLPWATGIDNAGLALRVQGASRREARARVAPWFGRFGLAGFEQARPAELSGGMRQRISFLRTLLAGKPVLALDEPFASLDAITRAQMQSWLGRVLQETPRTVVLITHDVEEAVLLADRVVVMSPRPGHVVAELPVSLPRPRRRTDPAVAELRGLALAALGVEA